jgi:xylulokinase
MTARAVLAVDVGTSSLKAALVTAEGGVLASSRARFPRSDRLYARSVDDWADALASAVSSLRIGEASAEISAIAISGNGPTVVAIGPDGSAGRVLLWNDAGPPEAEPPASAGAGPSLFIPRILAYARLFPADFGRARWMLSGPESLVHALTGEAVTVLPESRYESAYWTQEALAAFGLDPARLAPFVAPGTRCGHLAASLPAARPLLAAGVPPLTPVLACGPDFFVALVGTDALEPGRALDRAGTSEGLNVCVARETPMTSVRILPSPIAGLWNASYLIPDSGARFHAYRRETGQGGRSYPEIMDEIVSSPILPGKGETLHPGRRVVEEIGFAVRAGVETLRATTGHDPAYRLSGGQARNGAWNQMKADIAGATFTRAATSDCELLGNAAIAFRALGDAGSLEEAAARVSRVVTVYEPDPSRHRIYTERYEAYARLRDTAAT